MHNIYAVEHGLAEREEINFFECGETFIIEGEIEGWIWRGRIRVVRVGRRMMGREGRRRRGGTDEYGWGLERWGMHGRGWDG